MKPVIEHEQSLTPTATASRQLAAEGTARTKRTLFLFQHIVYLYFLVSLFIGSCFPLWFLRWFSRFPRGPTSASGALRAASQPACVDVRERVQAAGTALPPHSNCMPHADSPVRSPAVNACFSSIALWHDERALTGSLASLRSERASSGQTRFEARRTGHDTQAGAHEMSMCACTALV